MTKEVLSAEPDTYIQDDISRYGFEGWDAPDAGEDIRASQFGGSGDSNGGANNDARFMSDVTAFLQNRIANPSSKPFCLIVSLVNPHDVLSYPKSYNAPPNATTCEPAGGYTDDPWLNPFVPAIQLPPTATERLTANYKPAAQQAVLRSMAVGLGTLNPTQQTNYLNFYARLMILADQHL